MSRIWAQYVYLGKQGSKQAIEFQKRHQTIFSNYTLELQTIVDLYLKFLKGLKLKPYSNSLIDIQNAA